MNGVEVHVLHGSPGSEKTTLSRAMAELLRAADRPNAAIDLDDQSKVFPDPGRSFARDNLMARSGQVTQPFRNSKLSYQV